jgi:hypothetical protein
MRTDPENLAIICGALGLCLLALVVWLYFRIFKDN